MPLLTGERLKPMLNPLNFQFKLRKATKNDAPFAAEMTYLIDPYTFRYIFNLDEQRGRLLLSSFFKNDYYENGYINSYMAMDNDRAIGMVCLIDGGKLSFYFRLYCLLMKHLGILKFFSTYGRMMRYNQIISPISPEDLYLINLFVLPDYRGKHIGHLMLNHAVMLGKSLNKSRIKLDVWSHNVSAVGLYHKFDFHIDNRIEVDFLGGSPNKLLYHMIREL